MDVLNRWCDDETVREERREYAIKTTLWHHCQLSGRGSSLDIRQGSLVDEALGDYRVGILLSYHSCLCRPTVETSSVAQNYTHVINAIRNSKKCWITCTPMQAGWGTRCFTPLELPVWLADVSSWWLRGKAGAQGVVHLVSSLGEEEKLKDKRW